MQGILYTYGGEGSVESHKTLPMVSSDVDVLVVHGDEGSHEEASEGVSTVPGRDRAESFQEILANPSQSDNHRLEKSWWSVSRQHQNEGIDIRGGLGKEPEPEFP